MTTRSRRASEPERTADGRYLIIDGRRWRASDPAIPEARRRQLVGELMDARRAVAAGGGGATRWTERQTVDGVDGIQCASTASRIASGTASRPTWRSTAPSSKATRGMP